MFEPFQAAASGDKKRKGEQGLPVVPLQASFLDTISKQWLMKLLHAFGRAILYHEEALGQQAREVNVVIRASASHKFMLGMSHNLELYSKAGSEAKDAAKSGGKKYQGHPMGKRPNVLFKSLFFRFVDSVNVPDIQDEAILHAWEILRTAATTVQLPDCAFQASRCFRVVIKDTNEHKWIFHSQLQFNEMTAFRVLLVAKAFEDQGIFIEKDHAPRSGPTKDIHAMLFSEKTAKCSSKGSRGSGY